MQKKTKHKNKKIKIGSKTNKWTKMQNKNKNKGSMKNGVTLGPNNWK